MSDQAFPRPFVLQRDEDLTGISGTGTVAWGVLFPDGVVALRWAGANPTSVVFHDHGIAGVEAVHGHGGRTRIVWADDGHAAVYRERAELVAYLTRCYPSWVEDADAEWPIVYLRTPAGQLSWHVAREDMDLFDGLPDGGSAWDGHSTPEKYARLRRLP